MHKAAINTRDKAGINSALCVYIYTVCMTGCESESDAYLGPIMPAINTVHQLGVPPAVFYPVSGHIVIR